MIRRVVRGVTCASFLTALGAASACSSGGGSAPLSSSANRVVHAEVFAHPAWATAERLTANVAPSAPIAIQVHLQLKDPKAAADELAAISDPENAAYGHFLTDAEYDAKYAPSDAEVAAVREHLEANGLTVTHVPGNRTYVAATGTAAQVQAAFSTHLGIYNVNGALRRAPIDSPTVPASIAPSVLGVLGLTAPLEMKPRIVRTGGIPRNSIQRPGSVPNAIGGTGLCSEWFGQIPDVVDPPYGPGYPQLTYVPCGYVPAQLREAYGFSTSIRHGNDGTGVTVAVVDAYLSPTLQTDVETYSAQNDPDYPFGATQLTTYWAPGTATVPIPDWYTEQTLDVEAAHAMAPGANIVAVAAQSQSDQDLIAAVNLIIENKLATIVSNSYETQVEAGLTDALIWEAVGTQAGLKGVGLYFSSGDSGDDSYGGYYAPTVSFPGSLATITSVGGTSLALGELGQTLWETGWETGVSFLEETYPTGDDGGGDAGSGDDGGAPVMDSGSTHVRLAPSAAQATAAPQDGTVSAEWYPGGPGYFYFGGGGGVSILFPQPTYQKGIVPAAIADAPGVAARVIPDVSMVADPITGFVIGQTIEGGGYQEYPIGGTSLSSPLFAGVMALAQQNAKKTLGFANTLLYKASKKGAFNDPLPLASPQAVVIPQSSAVATFDFEQLSIHTTAGYDDVTGLGSPKGATFLSATK